MQQDDHERSYEDQYDDEEDYQSFGQVDIYGNEINDERTLAPVLVQSFEQQALEIIHESISNNPETFFHFVGGSAPSLTAECNNKNGLLHLAYTINKDINPTFPLPVVIDKTAVDYGTKCNQQRSVYEKALSFFCITRIMLSLCKSCIPLLSNSKRPI